MTWFRRFALALLTLIIACTSVPATAHADTTFLPLPVFATSRNEGNDYGFMPVWLLKDQSEYVYAIIAPSVIYNETTGFNFTFRYLGYPTVDRNYRIFVNRATKVDQEATVEYWDNKLMDGKFKLFGRFTFYKDSLGRFFGLSEKSREEDESNYMDVSLEPRYSIGYYLPHNFTVLWSERFKWMTVRRGKVKDLPYMRDKFPHVDGINGGAVWERRLTLSYDTRDDEVFPTKGVYANVFGEFGHGFSHGRIYSRTGINGRTYISLNDERFITVLKGEMEYTGGSHVPFFARSRIGGENTLRGYGVDRFIDDGFILLNVEERVRLFRLHIFGVWSEWETAPFVDIGRVYSSLSKGFFKGWQFNPGLGFRAIVRPNVVGRVDFGYGKEGLNAFVGLDLPF